MGRHGDWITETDAHVVQNGGHAALEKTLFLSAGQRVVFDWNHAGDRFDWAYALFHAASDPFWTGEYLRLDAPMDVPTLMRLDLRDPSCALGDICAYETGWQVSSFTAHTPGMYTITFAVFDTLDPGWMSALWVDNLRTAVPEPSTSILLLAGLLVIGLTMARRDAGTDSR